MAEPKVNVVWRPQAGPQKALVDCPFPEVFFGGARGGGKTDGVLGKWALKEQRYGAGFNAIGFRRTTVSFEDAVQRARQIYLPLGAKFTDKPARFRMPNGGRVSFSYLDSIADADEYQGRNLSDAWVEEAGQYPDPAPIDRLFGALRSSGGVPIQLILTANPGGAGQHWIAQRYGMIPFPTRPKVVERRLADGAMHRMAVIPSRITDNRLLLESDPGYIHRLQLVGSAALVRAWVEGDWSAIEGAFFPEWSEAKHIIPPFTIPDHWLRFRSGDWGSAKPFSIGWWAVVSDDYLLDGQNAHAHELPRGALVRYREWYGASSSNVGLKLTAESVAAGIVEREEADEEITYSVLDPAAFSSDGGPSIAERMANPHGIFWQRADNARIARNGAMGGWDQVRARLIGTAQRNEATRQIDWSTGRPMLYAFSTCRDFIRTLPALQHDRSRAEDVDSDGEDHAPDECVVAATLIETERGPVYLCNLSLTDKVLTRTGFQNIRAIYSTGEKDVSELIASNGSVLFGTGNHPIFVDGKGFVPLAKLRYGDILRTCEKQSSSTAGRTLGNQTIQTGTSVSISGTDTIRYIGRFIKRQMEKYRSGILSTTKTIIRSITSWIIWRQSRPEPIPSIIGNNLLGISWSARIAAHNTLLRFLGAQTNSAGTLVNRRRDESLALIMKQDIAKNAGQDFRLINTRSKSSAAIDAENQASILELIYRLAAWNVEGLLKPKIDEPSTVLLHVVSVTSVGKQEVFNISVDGNEEYFANGILVHNCRYACMSRPWVNSSPEERQPKFLQDATLDDLWDTMPKRAGGRI